MGEVDLINVPFTARESRLLLFHDKHGFSVQMAESYFSYATQTPLHHIQIAGAQTPQILPYAVLAGQIQWIIAKPEVLLLHGKTTAISFMVEGQHQFTIQGGQASGEINISYTIQPEPDNKEFHNGQITLGWQEATEITIAFTIKRGEISTVSEHNFEDDFEQVKTKWLSWQKAIPILAESTSRYDYAWWLMDVNRIRNYAHPERLAMSPSKLHYVGCWLWDAYFHAIAYRHHSPAIAKEQLRTMMDHQLADGMLPDVIHDGGIITESTDYVEGKVTKPPLLAWTAWKIYETDGDIGFLDEIYAPAVDSQAWWLNECDRDGNGLYEYMHPYSSGLDDNPLFDGGVPLESPDLNAYLILQADTLAQISELLGKSDASMWREQAEAITNRLIEQRWNPGLGLFNAVRHNEVVPVKTPFQLLPLLVGRLPQAIRNRMVQTLKDPQQFWGDYGIPTVAFDDPHFDANQMWRGPIWLNVHYLLIEGLKRSGFPDVAQEIRQKSLQLINESGRIAEYYNPHTGQNPPKAVDMFGWSAALYIDLSIQK